MLERSQVAIIIPAYNEANTIARVVENVNSYGRVIVVDDCSHDNTSLLAEQAGAVVVKHSVNKGYDAALNSGFAEAKRLSAQYAITFDADGQHDKSFISTFLSHLQQGNDLVLGVRPNKARLAELVFSIYTRLRFGFFDPLCGMKGYRMNLYEELGHFDSYKSIGTELSLYGLRKGKAFVQILIPIKEREDQPRFGRIFSANLRIFRAMFCHLLHKNNY